MSAIKTIYVLYKAITSDLKQGNDEVLKSNEKVAKSMKNTADLAENFVNKVRGLAKEIAVASGLIYTASQFIGDFKNAVNYGRELSVTSNLLNINAEELQAWGNVLKHVGGDAKSFEENLQALGSYFNIRADKAIQILPLLADAFQKLNPQQATTLGNTYGLTPDFILTLRKGREEISKMLEEQKSFGLATQAQVDNFGKLNDKIIDAGNATRGLFLGLASDSLPALNTTFDKITESLIYLTNHLDEFEKGLKVAAAGATIIIAALIPTLGGFAAALLAVVAAFKAWQALDIFGKTSAVGAIGGQGLYGNSWKDWLTGNATLNSGLAEFNYDISQPIGTAQGNFDKNYSSIFNYTQNVDVGSIQANDAKGLYKQLNSYSNFSQAFQTAQAQNQVASGVQI